MIESYNSHKIKRLFLNYLRSLMVFLVVAISGFFLVSNLISDRHNVSYTLYPLTGAQIHDEGLLLFGNNSTEIRNHINSTLDSVLSRYVRKLDGVDKLRMETRDSHPYKIFFYNLSSNQIQEAESRVKEVLELTKQSMREWKDSLILLKYKRVNGELQHIERLFQEIDAERPYLKLHSYFLTSYVRKKTLKSQKNIDIPEQLFSEIDITVGNSRFGFVYYMLAFFLGFVMWILHIYIKESYNKQ